MKGNKEISGMLDLMIRPGFCVKDNLIVKVNQAARGLLLTPGTDVRTLLMTGKEEYEAFLNGCLYLKLNLSSMVFGACVARIEEYDVFTLDPESDNAELRAMALAATELVQPLNNAVAITDNLLPKAVFSEDPKVSDLIARLNRNLYQMQRILGNMSDAGHGPAVSQQRLRNISKVFDDIFAKAEALVAHTGIRLHYDGLEERNDGLVDASQLERAVLNILSNAIKFTPKDGSIEAKLTRQGKMLRLSILDSGSGIGENILSNVFNRYQRQPGIEDSRYGLGLGMVMIRSAAASHGGTVLIDQPEGKGTRVTMTLEIRQDTGHSVRTPIDLPGGQDQGLIELSDCLPVSVYEK